MFVSFEINILVINILVNLSAIMFVTFEIGFGELRDPATPHGEVEGDSNP